MPKTCLYLGLSPKNFSYEGIITHLPLIETQKIPLTHQIKKYLIDFSAFTTLIITSKTAVKNLITSLNELFQTNDIKLLFEKITIFSVGPSTTQALNDYNIKVSFEAKTHTSEGLVELLKNYNWLQKKVFYPHSELSRPIIRNFLEEKQINFKEAITYTTQAKQPYFTPSLKEYNSIIFTSPSTVDAFLKFFSPPEKSQLYPIGPVTKNYLYKRLNLLK
jgi:uroporphyrinogen-III synthase